MIIFFPSEVFDFFCMAATEATSYFLFLPSPLQQYSRLTTILSYVMFQEIFPKEIAFEHDPKVISSCKQYLLVQYHC